MKLDFEDIEAAIKGVVSVRSLDGDIVDVNAYIRLRRDKRLIAFCGHILHLYRQAKYLFLDALKMKDTGVPLYGNDAIAVKEKLKNTISGINAVTSLLFVADGPNRQMQNKIVEDCGLAYDDLFKYDTDTYIWLFIVRFIRNALDHPECGQLDIIQEGSADNAWRVLWGIRAEQLLNSPIARNKKCDDLIVKYCRNSTHYDAAPNDLRSSSILPFADILSNGNKALDKLLAEWKSRIGCSIQRGKVRLSACNTSYEIRCDTSAFTASSLCKLSSIDSEIISEMGIL